MKIVSKIYKGFAVVAVVAFGALTSSCTDYLTIIPADKVVEENFWQTKDQVNGMLATSYLKLLDKEAVKRAIVWGELRSETMTFNPSRGGDIKNIVEADIIDENNYCNWGIYYEAISNANLVLECADRVLDRDPDFSEGDCDVVKGEMYAMRALCHFYLVRAFRDIPLALVPAANDAELPDYAQVHPLEALNKIMEDLDRAETLVRKSDIERVFDNAPEYQPRERVMSDSPQGYTTVRLCSEKYKIPFPTVYKYLKEHNVPFKKVRNKDYYSRTHAERVLEQKLAQEYPEIKEWYTLREIMEKYQMTESAVLTFIYEHGIPRKRKKGGLYSKKHVDEIKRRKLDPNDEYYSVQDCMAKYHLTRDQVYHFLRYYKIERIQSGRCVRFRKEEFDRYCVDPEGSVL